MESLMGFLTVLITILVGFKTYFWTKYFESKKYAELKRDYINLKAMKTPSATLTANEIASELQSFVVLLYKTYITSLITIFYVVKNVENVQEYLSILISNNYKYDEKRNEKNVQIISSTLVYIEKNIPSSMKERILFLCYNTPGGDEIYKEFIMTKIRLWTSNLLLEFEKASAAAGITEAKAYDALIKNVLMKTANRFDIGGDE